MSDTEQIQALYLCLYDGMVRKDRAMLDRVLDDRFVLLMQNGRNQEDQGGQQDRCCGKPEPAGGFFLHYSLQSSFQRSARFRRGSDCGCRAGSREGWSGTDESAAED